MMLLSAESSNVDYVTVASTFLIRSRSSPMRQHEDQSDLDTWHVETLTMTSAWTTSTT